MTELNNMLLQHLVIIELIQLIINNFVTAEFESF